MSNYIIAGANSEIGRALAKHLADNGHNLMLVSRSRKDSGFLSGCTWLDGIDLTDEYCLKALKQEVERRFDYPFNYIHSVGDFWKHKDILNTDLAEVKDMIISHYITLFYAIKAIVPVMRAVNGGRIIAFSCNSVKYNYPEMAAFTSAKAAVECLAKNKIKQYSFSCDYRADLSQG